jgi:hypothetical protein
MRFRDVWLLALLTGLSTPGGALAAGTRPTAADIAACREFVRMQPDLPAYTETAPTNPFPSRLSHVAPWTGPVAPTLPPRPEERPLAPAPAEPPDSSGGLEQGDNSQEAASEPGLVEPGFREAFDSCMRARGF